MSTIHISETIRAAYQQFGVFGSEKPQLIPTGIDAIDKNMGGLMPGSLSFVGARTNLGKSTLLLNMGLASATAGFTTVYISGEDPIGVIGGKLQSRWSCIPLMELTRNGHALGQSAGIKKALDATEKLPFFASFPSVRTIWAIQRLLSDSYDQHKPRIMFFDYLTTIRPDGKKDMRSFYSDVIMMLREFALSKKIPVVCGSQMTRRPGEVNENYEPTLRELSETGNIENYSDLILLLWADDSGQRFLKIAKNKIAGHYKPRLRCGFDPNTEVLTTSEVTP